MRRLKLLWDFFGERAEGMAQHHAKHVEEFVQREGFEATSGSGAHPAGHYCAWLVLDEVDALKLREVLRPNRAVLADPSDA